MRHRPAPPRSVASRITAILSTFLTGESHSITEIAHMTGLPVSTTHRISADLAAWQLLQRAADGRYGVGSILQRLGGVAVAAPATLPAHASAAGKAILAFSSPATVRRVAQNLVTFTPLTVNTPDRLRRALGIVRLARTAVARAELAPGQSDVAAPVFGCGGVAVAALELEVRNLATELEVARAALAVAARGLSRQLTVDPVDPPGWRQLRLAPALGGTAAGA
jgi:IclR family transcriptional regulator, acetate operon repressor